jgi:uncharacterized repeat protein (TIGR02543 family)
MAAILGGNSGYSVDYVRPGMGYRVKLDVDSAGSTNAIWQKVLAIGGKVGLAFYTSDGTTLWIDVSCGGSTEDNSAFMTFASSPEKEAFKVSYDANGGELNSDAKSIRREGEMLSRYDNSASKEGMYFCGWYTEKEGGDRFLPSNPVKKDLTLYAHFCKNETGHVSYDFNYSSPSDGNLTVTDVSYAKNDDGTFDIDSLPSPEREGYKFVGWFDGNGEEAKTTGLTDSVTYVAKWEEK